jgi:hypothetical protein
VLEIARPDQPVEHDRVTDAQIRQRSRRPDSAQQRLARADRVGDRHEMIIERACRDLVEELPLGSLDSRIVLL